MIANSLLDSCINRTLIVRPEWITTDEGALPHRKGEDGFISAAVQTPLGTEVEKSRE